MRQSLVEFADIVELKAKASYKRLFEFDKSVQYYNSTDVPIDNT